MNIRDTVQLSNYVQHQLGSSGSSVGLGGYLERREWYARSGVFSCGKEVRCIHLGVDIWTRAGEPVYSPVEGRVHSFQDNASFGDYGPTIIIEHETERGNFCTLYGHLSRDSLAGVSVGKKILTGQFSNVSRLEHPCGRLFPFAVDRIPG